MTSDSAITGPATDPTRHNHAGLQQRESAAVHPIGETGRGDASGGGSVSSHPRGAAASSAHSATGSGLCAVVSLPGRPEQDAVGLDAHRCAVLARFVEARGHIDLVIAQLRIEGPGTPTDLPRAQIPAHRRSTCHGVADSIADAIEALDLAFEAWLDGTATEPIREPRT